MAERILHVSLRADGRSPSKAMLIEVLNYAPDWVVYAPNCWLLWTAESVSTWYSRLRRVVAAEDKLLIFRADYSDYEGFMPDIVWDWLRKYRNRESVRPAETTDSEPA